MIEIGTITQPVSGGSLRAARVDYPGDGLRIEGYRLEVVGWAVGDPRAFVSVELLAADRPIATGALVAGRDDVARDYAGSAQGDHVSFHLSSTLPRGFEGTIRVMGVMADGSSIPLGEIPARCRSSEPRGVVVLMYHRIASIESEPWRMSVSPGHFDEQLGVLRRRAKILRLEDLDRGAHDLTSGPGVIVTFDDGYADNLTRALPVLEAHEVPATVFLSTGFVGQDHEFWWDELERILLEPGTRPHEIALRFEGRTWNFDLGADADYPADTARRHSAWRAGSGQFPTRRHEAYRSLWDTLSVLSPGSRGRAIEDLALWAGTERLARPTHRALTGEELARFSRSPLIEVGAHTVTHSALAALPVDAQRTEIVESRATLESWVSRPVTRFAYPYGTREHYNEDTIRLLEQAGFTSACANTPACAVATTPRFEIPRFIVPDLDGDAFEDALDAWLEV